MIFPPSNRELVKLAIDAIDAEIDRGVNPVRAIHNVAIDRGIAYEKLEYVYIEGCKTSRASEYDDAEAALD